MTHKHPFPKHISNYIYLLENCIVQRKADVANALISVELRQSLKLSEFDCKKESHLFGTEIEPEHLKDGNMVWAREQIKKKLSNRGAEILKQIGTDVDGIFYFVFYKHAQ